LCIVVHTCMTCRISRFQDGGSLNNYITIFLAEGIWKCIYFVIYLYVFKLVCTRRENFIRIGITVLYLKSCRCQLWIWRSQISAWASPVKWHLRPSNPQLTPSTLQIQYCYSLIGCHLYDIPDFLPISNYVLYSIPFMINWALEN
jgi:hypothetical protein